MAEKHIGPGGDPAEGSRQTANKNLDQEAKKQSPGDKPPPKTPEKQEGDTGGGKHAPVKSETGA